MKKKKNTKKVWKVIGIGIGIGILVIFMAIIVYLFRITHITIGEDFIKSKNNAPKNNIIGFLSFFQKRHINKVIFPNTIKVLHNTLLIV